MNRAPFRRLWKLSLIAAVCCGGEPAPAASARSLVDTAIDRPDLAAYRGWLKFLRSEAEIAPEKMTRLTDWAARISANPALLGTLRGTHDWAYESPVDESGQPFRISIPSDYDPARPTPLVISMHGYSGSPLDTPPAANARAGGALEVSVLGRSRGGGFRALSEADVLQVADYVIAHWNVDPDRVRLTGGSMGGYGTYRIGSRYPHRWASLRPNCGWASPLPVANFLTTPIYALHSADDWTVSSLHDRGPLTLLRELGGQVIYDETDGLGHAVEKYTEGMARGRAWAIRQVRPASREVRHIDYTALDGDAVRGWWAEVAEWGPAPRPARFVLTAGGDNTLYATLTNVTRLRVRLAESPFDRAQPLHLAINGAPPITFPAPLPDDVALVLTSATWTCEKFTPPTGPRLHTPGAASLLYNGEPLLIVYGTTGNETENAALRAAAEAASKSPNPIWPDDSGGGKDGVPHSQNLYGRLRVKPDTAVTAADLVRCHLVLIGTATQNILVARLAEKLPVRLTAGTITCSDGATFPAAQRALGLVHFNPLAPDRLIFWVASDDPRAYAPKSTVPRLMGGGGIFGSTPFGNAFGGDLVIADSAGPALVAVRTFDSHWAWNDCHADSPLLSSPMKTNRDVATALGAALRRQTGAEFALVSLGAPPDEATVTPGVTRLSDLAPVFFYAPVGIAEMTGAELLAAHRRAGPDAAAKLALAAPPAFDLSTLDPLRRYRVALPVDSVHALAQVLKIAPGPYRHTDLQVADALAFWPE